MIRPTQIAVMTCFICSGLLPISGCKNSSATSSAGSPFGVVEASSSSELSGPPTMNATYGARNPRVCAKLMTVPNANQAAALVQCSLESDSTGSATPQLTLTTDVRVEIAAGRVYIPEINTPSSIDPSAKVYPIRGQGTLWQCGDPSFWGVGTNCTKYMSTRDSDGECYKTTFGDWQCRMPVGNGPQIRKQSGPTTY